MACCRVPGRLRLQVRDSPGQDRSTPARVSPPCGVLQGLSPAALLKLLIYHKAAESVAHALQAALVLLCGSSWPESPLVSCCNVLACPLMAATRTLCSCSLPLSKNKSPTANVFLQVLAPLPEPSETHRGQILPPEQEHDYATYHEALPVARGGCQQGCELRRQSS